MDEATADAAGVILSYVDPSGVRHLAEPETIRRLVEALDGPPPAALPWPSDTPVQAWRPARQAPDWGIFLPHHALRTSATRGFGDATALARLGVWIGSRGGRVLGTLPLLPTFLHDTPTGPFEPSPYAPVSRHFWGEHLVDPTAAPEWASTPHARAVLQAAEQDGRLAALRDAPLADPAGAWALQWELLSALAETAWADPDFERRMTNGLAPERVQRLQAYSAFRAATLVRGPWPTWADASRFEGDGPLSLRAGDLPDVDPAIVRTFAYAQHEARRQLRALSRALHGAGVSLYLDLPLGTHPDGFDTFIGTGSGPLHVSGISAGAPPDPYFPSGQDWGFPPVHPHTSSETHHADLRGALAHHAELADRLRIDHVLGFYRLFWVPGELGASKGAYVRYPAQGWWEALVEASHDHRCAMIGENLGVVPQELTAALERHGIPGMQVGQFELDGHHDWPIRSPRPGDLTCLNTHDTPTFAGWWEQEDLDTHEALGWVEGQRLADLRAGRSWLRDRMRPLADTGPLAGASHVDERVRVAAALYERLAQTQAGTVLVNLEDLWGEVRPHNVPGTWRERPNWLRRCARSLEEVQRDPVVERVLEALSRVRSAPGDPS